jgi:hypothetical protein
MVLSCRSHVTTLTSKFKSRYSDWLRTYCSEIGVSPLHIVQTCSGAHPYSSSLSTGG